MELFEDKNAIAGVALDTSIGSGKKQTLEDSLKLKAVVVAMEDEKEEQRRGFMVFRALFDFISDEYGCKLIENLIARLSKQWYDKNRYIVLNFSVLSL